MQQNSARTEGLLQIDGDRRPEKIAARCGRGVLLPDAACCQMHTELITTVSETGGTVECQREPDFMQRHGGNGRVEANTGGPRMHREGDMRVGSAIYVRKCTTTCGST